MKIRVGMLPVSNICATDWLTVHGLDFGIPAEMTAFVGLTGIVHNDKNSGLGTFILQAPAWSFFGKLELQKPHSQAGAWERAKPINRC